LNYTPDPSDFGDFVQTFQIEDLNIRGRLVRLDHAYNEAIAGHDYPPAVKQLVGEAMVLTSVLASALKYDGVFTLQVQGDGPVTIVMADITTDGAMRAYAKLKDGAGDTVTADSTIPALLGNGRMAFTVDQGPDTERYQGITELAGTTLAECAHDYFRQSEQLETAIAITANAGGNDMHARAAGLMVQRLPSARDGEQEEENWRRAVVLMNSITPEELLDPALSAPKVLYRLYHEDGVRLFEQSALRHECRCSEDRVSRTLQSFPRTEVDEMAEDGLITVTCEFCRTDYVYDTARLDELYADNAE
jgi:molecular chaperone Hsp33